MLRQFWLFWAFSALMSPSWAQGPQRPFSTENDQLAFECLSVPDRAESQVLRGKTSYAPNGAIHTPKGNLHILVVYVNFTNVDLMANQSTWYQNRWPNTNNGNFPGPLPDYAQPGGSGAINGLFTEDPNDIPGQTVQNLSSLYHRYSNPSDRFKLTGHVYPVTVPVTYSAGNYSGMNRAALDWIGTNDPNFPWSDFDQRTNAGYSTDNSNSGPDGYLDYVVFIYRELGGSGIASSYSYGHTIAGTNSMKGGYGHMFLRHGLGETHFWNGFTHEFAHVNQSAPHYGGANNTHGYKYYVNTMWGLMQYGGTGFRTPNAWESWWRGWITPTEVTPTNINAAGLYLLRDYATDRQALRIRIPFSNQDSSSGNYQYLWLENHQKWADFDRKDQWLSNCMETMDKGVYMYVVDGTGSDRYQPTGLSANLIRPISCRGTVDYLYTGNKVSCNDPTKTYHLFDRTENSVGGINDRIFIPYNTDPEVNPNNPDNRIDLRQFTGNSNVKPYNFVWPNAETSASPQVGWWWTGAKGQSFAQFTEASFSAGIPLLNTPSYNHGWNGETFEPVYLNGLSVKIQLIHPDGTAEVYVSYDDHFVDGHKRWTHPNMMLPDLDPNSTADAFEIISGGSITMNASGTPNRETIHPVTGTWVTPPSLTIESGGHLLLEANSDLIMEDGAQLVIQNGGTLEVGSGGIVHVRDLARLEIESGGRLLVHDGGQVLVDTNAEMVYHPNALLQLDGQSSLLALVGQLDVRANADFTFTDASGSRADSGYVHVRHPQAGNNPSNIIAGSNARFTFAGANDGDLVLRVDHGAYVFPDTPHALFTIENARVELGEDAFMQMLGGGYRLNRIHVAALDVMRPHRGLLVNGQANQYMRHVTVRNGVQGIAANQTLTDGATLQANFVEITDCDTGLEVIGAGAVLTAVDLLYNTVGYRHLNATAPSRLQSCHIDQNQYMGVEFSSNGGDLHVKNSTIDDNGYRGVQFQGNGTVTGFCSSISRNGIGQASGAGLFAGWQSTVAFDDALEAAGSQMTILDNPTAIWLGLAADIYLDMGRNDLVTNPENLGRSVYGTLAKSCTNLTLVAEENHWNRRTTCPGKPPAVGADYQVSGFVGCTIDFTDPVRHCPGPCAVSGGGSGGSGSVNSPLSICKCSALTTQSFSGVPLNEAFITVRNQTGDDAFQLALDRAEAFAEILTTELPEPSQTEQLILDQTRHAMMGSLAEARTSATYVADQWLQAADMVLVGLDAVAERAMNEAHLRVVALERAAVYQMVGDLVAATAAEASYPAEPGSLEEDARHPVRVVMELMQQVASGELAPWAMQPAIRDLLPLAPPGQ